MDKYSEDKTSRIADENTVAGNMGEQHSDGYDAAPQPESMALTEAPGILLPAVIPENLTNMLAGAAGAARKIATEMKEDPEVLEAAGEAAKKMARLLRTEVMPGQKLNKEESIAAGREMRKKVNRGLHAQWNVQEKRTKPLEILEAQERDRVHSLLSIRHERMCESAFAYYRGAAAVMAYDLAQTPVTGFVVQDCGDAHIGNFGFFGTAEKRIVFDINDFDETYPGPWEWDVKRLAASIEICGRFRKFSESDRTRAVRKALDSYHDAMEQFSSMGMMDVWYSHLDAEEMQRAHDRDMPKGTSRMLEKTIESAAKKNSLRAVHKWTETVGGQLRIRSIPPILVPYRDMKEDRVSPENVQKFLKAAMRQYRLTLPREVRNLLDQYTMADIAQKVVGVGSVGMRSYIMVLEGSDADDPLVLQMKEATDSVLKPYVDRKTEGELADMIINAAGLGSEEADETASGGTGTSSPRMRDMMREGMEKALNVNGRRVVTGQKAIQTAGDILLGWMSVPDLDGRVRDFYVRQLWNNKGTVDLSGISAADLEMLSGACGWTLAHAHARTGDRHAIASYLGNGRKFEESVAEFAQKYADQNEADYQMYVKKYAAQI